MGVLGVSGVCGVSPCVGHVLGVCVPSVLEVGPGVGVLPTGGFDSVGPGVGVEVEGEGDEGPLFHDGITAPALGPSVSVAEGRVLSLSLPLLLVSPVF